MKLPVNLAEDWGCSEVPRWILYLVYFNRGTLPDQNMVGWHIICRERAAEDVVCAVGCYTHVQGSVFVESVKWFGFAH